VPRNRFPRYDSVTSEGVRTFRRNINYIVGLSKLHSVEPVILTYPTSLTNQNTKTFPRIYKPVLNFVETLTYAGIQDGLKKHNAALLEVAQAHNLLVIDASHQMPIHLDYFYDHVHFTPLGTELLAKLVGQALVERRFAGCPGDK